MSNNYDIVKQIIPKYNSVWSVPDKKGTESSRIPATALLGNGDTGAVSFSDYGRVSFCFSKSNFWEYMGAPLPIGALSLDIVSGRKSGFYECQDILNARVITETGSVHAESFICSGKNLFIMKLNSDSDIRVRLSLDAKKGGNRPFSSALNDDKIAVTRQTLFYGNKTLTAVIAATVVGADIYSVSCVDGNASVEFNLNQGDEVCVAAAICSSRQTAADPYSRALFMLDKIKSLSYIDTVEKDHAVHWYNYWNASFVNFDTDDKRFDSILKYYYAAQYLLGIGVFEGACAPGLYGIWHTTDDSPWRSDYHLNYNFISSFYGCASSNRPNQLLPACVAINDYIEQGKKNAADFSQIEKFEKSFVEKLLADGKITRERGLENTVLYPVGIAPYGTADFSYWNETMNAAYSAYPMIEYCRSTMDGSFRRQILYPYLKLVLGILDSWLVEDETGYTLYAGYNEGSWSKNPAVELAAYKMCLKEAISCAKDDSVDADCVNKWQKYLDGLACQPIGMVKKKKVFSLAEEEFENGKFSPLQECVPDDGNAIPLDCIIPGGVSGYFSPSVTSGILKNTVDVFNSKKAWKNCNNFPRLFAYAVNINYNIERIVTAFADVIDKQIMKNNMIDDKVHGFEKAGATRAVNNMFLLCDRGVIKLFPNWCRNINASFGDLRAEGAFLFSATWNADEQKLQGVSMHSEVGGYVKIALENETPFIVTDSQGNNVNLELSALPDRPDCRYITFSTVAGETYKLV